MIFKPVLWDACLCPVFFYLGLLLILECHLLISAKGF